MRSFGGALGSAWWRRCSSGRLCRLTLTPGPRTGRRPRPGGGARRSTLDLEDLAEEVEAGAEADLNMVRSQVRRIIEHLLKLEFAPSMPPRGDSAPLGRAGPRRGRGPHHGEHVSGRGGPRQAVRARPARCRPGAGKEAARKRCCRCPWFLDQIVSPDWYPQNATASSTTSRTTPKLDGPEGPGPLSFGAVALTTPVASVAHVLGRAERAKESAPILSRIAERAW